MLLSEELLMLISTSPNLKIVWDEIQVLKLTPNCSCQPNCNPECDAIKVVKDHVSTDYVRYE